MPDFVEFKRGTTIFKQGDPADVMYIITSGRVRLTDPQGRQADIFLDTGSFFGEIGLLKRDTRTLSAKAAEHTSLLQVNRDNFLDLVAKQPRLALRIIQALVDRLEAVEASQTLAQTAEEAAGDGPRPASDPGKTPDKQAVPTHTATTCPICKSQVSMEVLSTETLIPIEYTPELRPRYADVEPLWYNIWVCPECYYAVPGNEWEMLQDQERLVLTNNRNTRSIVFRSADFRQPRTLELGMASVRAALYCLRQLERSPLHTANRWLELAWLLGDGGHVEEQNRAYLNALENYRKLPEKPKSDEDPKEQQRQLYVTAQLERRAGQPERATKLFQRVVELDRGEKSFMGETAREAIQELRPG